MQLNYTASDEDYKFLFYYYEKKTQFRMNDKLSYDNLENEDEIIEKLFLLANEEISNKKNLEFRKIRLNPISNKNMPEVTVLSLLNYINLIKLTITTGTLKYKEYIDKYTAMIRPNIEFDPDFYLMDIRAGYIESIEDAEGMDKLYCENVKANKDYFICSGLRGRYAKEDLIKNVFLFLLNIKKVKFKTLESEGMILCTESDKIEPIKIGSPQGTKVQLSNFISLFDNIEYGKIDFSKNAYKTIFSQFKITDHHLTFKGIKLICDSDFITTLTCTGEVR